MAGEWEVGTLGDIADVIMGQSPPGDRCYSSPVGKPLLNGPTEFGGHHPRPVQFTDNARKLSAPGDLLFCVRGSTTGRMNWADQTYAIGRGLAAIRPRHGSECAHFVRSVVELGLPSLLAAATGSTFPNVSREQLRSLECLLPPIQTQRAIAHVLGTLDDLIELNRETNQILEEMARALFKSWFVDFDPVRAKLEGRPPAGMDAETAALFPDQFQDSELGQIPKGWKVGTISDLAKIQNQSVNPASEPDQVWEHYSIPAFDAGFWPASDKGDEIKSNKYRIPEGSVLLSKLNPDTQRVWIPDVATPDVAICSTEFLPFVPLTQDTRSFFFELLRSGPIFSEICNRATGSTGSRQRVKPREVEEIPTLIPPCEVIRAFAGTTEINHEMIALNLRESRDLANLRDTLLPKLLSGELRVPDAEKAVE